MMFNLPGNKGPCGRDEVATGLLFSVIVVFVALVLVTLILIWITDGFMNAVIGLLVSGITALIGLPFVMFSIAWFGNRLPGIDRCRERGEE